MITLGRATRVKLIGVGALGLALMTGFLLKDLRDYCLRGSQPSELTVAQVRETAARKPFVRRWVRLTEPLQLDCSRARGWVEDGKTSIVVLAFDASRQQPFWVEYNDRSQNCDDLKTIALEGMLVEPEKFWIKQGMVRPSSQYPLMELKVGATPSDLRRSAASMGAADLIFIAMLWVGYASSPRKR